VFSFNESANEEEAEMPFDATLTDTKIDPITGAITGKDILHGNKPVTVTFTASCPGGGADASNTSVRLGGACASALQDAVRARRTLNFTWTRNPPLPQPVGSLSSVNHYIT
jgi:hypothetical protein